MLRIPMGASENDIRKTLKEAADIADKIKAGMDFPEAARKFSKDRNARIGGDMGLVSLSDLARVFREALEGLEDGQITRPLKLGQTVQILQLVQRLDKEEKIFIRAQREIQEILEREELKKRFEIRFKDIREKSVIEIKL